METLNASDAKREFGEVLIKAQRGPIAINKNGKPIAVVLSATEYAELDALRQQQLKAAIEEGIADLQVGRVNDGHAVLTKLRNKLGG